MPKFGLEGKEYAYDGKVLVDDAMFIHEKSGVGLGRLNYELAVEGNPKVIVAWMYLLKRRAGEAVKWEDTKRWDLATFKLIPDESAAGGGVAVDGEVAGEEADPTNSTTGKTRKRGTTNT